MKSTPIALVNHATGTNSTMCTCWKVTLAVTGEVRGFTNNVKDLLISGVTYLAKSGFTPSDIAMSAGLNVDNMEVSGMLLSPSITDAELDAGLWDSALVEMFMVNYRDLTMGRHILPGFRLGDISTGRDSYKAEIRGLKQAYELNVVRLYLPTCPYQLGDSDCTVNMVPFTFTGTVATVNADNVTFYDGTLTQPGPTGGIAITGVTNANPCVISLAVEGQVTEQAVVTLSGIVGPALLNTTVVAHLVSGQPAKFSIAVDTTDTAAYPAYVSGGVMTPQGGDSGYFDNGIVRWLTGANAGQKMEVSAYVPGQVRLMLPMPNPIAPVDTYEIKAGCDHTFPTCRDKYHNGVNFGGFPYLPGQDRVLLIGRST